MILTFLKAYMLVLMSNGRIRRCQYEEMKKDEDVKRKYIYMLKQVIKIGNEEYEDHVSFIK